MVVVIILLIIIYPQHFCKILLAGILLAVVQKSSSSNPMKASNARNVVLVLLRSAPTGAEVLLVREQAGRAYHKWGLPGGGIEPVDRGSARHAFSREAREEIGLVPQMWFNHANYHVDYVMCGSTAYFFRVVRPQYTHKHGLVYLNGQTTFQFRDPVTGVQELDGAHWTPLSVILSGTRATETFLQNAGRRSNGLRGCFARCLDDKNVLGALRGFQSI